MRRNGGPTRAADLTAGEVFGRRLAEVRKRRGWSAKKLAEKVEIGLGEKIHRVRLAKLETDPAKARRVTLEEVLAISYALDVSPLYMIAPIEHDPELDPQRGVIISGNVQPAKPDEIRGWLRGEEPLLYQDERVFALERPAEKVPTFIERRPHLLHWWRSTFRYPKEER